MTGHVLVDLGNTRWKVATASGGIVGEVRQGAYDAPESFATAISDLARDGRAVLLASVVDRDRTNGFLSIASEVAAGKVRRVRAGEPVPGVRSGYRDPAQLGVDRLLAMVSARSRCAGPVCVVDAGSAVTIDFVDADGLHIGGLILPGHRLARESLLARTSIPHDADIEAGARLGRDTPTAVALGSRYAVAGIVERFVVGSQALFPRSEPRVFLGGGDAAALEPLMPLPCERVEHLVLSGLAILAAAEDA